MSESPFSEEWVREIDRRLAELDAGTAQTVPWSQIRAEALARIGCTDGKLDEFDQAIAESSEKLGQVAAKALAEYRARLTDDLDPDRL